MPSGALVFVCQRTIEDNFSLSEVNFNPKPVDEADMLTADGFLAFDFLRDHQA
jgi:hypothetical protein